MSAHVKLHSFTGNTDHDFTGLQSGQFLKLNAAGDAIESAGSSGVLITGTGTSNYVTKWSSSGSGLTNSQIFDDGTNVGVNVTPSAKFHVKGNSGFFIESDDVGYGSFKFRPYSTQQTWSSIQSSDGAELRWGGALGSPLGYNEFAFYNTATTDVKLAINHLSPDATLHAVGNRADSATTVFITQNSASTRSLTIRDDGVVFFGPTTAWDGFASTHFTKSGYILQESPQGYKLNDNSGTGGFWGIQSPSNNLLTIERFGIGAPMMIFDSNLFKVGVFTSAPTAQLHLRNTTYTDGFRIESVNGTDLIFDSSGRLGINTPTPTEKLHISGGTIRIQTVNGTEGAGKIAISDANGSISFSSTTALGLITSAGTVNKYSVTLTTPGAGVTNTITHNLGTTDITVTLWLVSTGDMTSARITNRQTNSVDVIFSSAPGEDVRVVITG